MNKYDNISSFEKEKFSMTIEHEKKTGTIVQFSKYAEG